MIGLGLLRRGVQVPARIVVAVVGKWNPPPSSSRTASLSSATSTAVGCHRLPHLRGASVASPLLSVVPSSAAAATSPLSFRTWSSDGKNGDVGDGIGSGNRGNEGIGASAGGGSDGRLDDASFSLRISSLAEDLASDNDTAVTSGASVANDAPTNCADDGIASSSSPILPATGMPNDSANENDRILPPPLVVMGDVLVSAAAAEGTIAEGGSSRVERSKRQRRRIHVSQQQRVWNDIKHLDVDPTSDDDAGDDCETTTMAGSDSELRTRKRPQHHQPTPQELLKGYRYRVIPPASPPTTASTSDAPDRAARDTVPQQTPEEAAMAFLHATDADSPIKIRTDGNHPKDDATFTSAWWQNLYDNILDERIEGGSTSATAANRRRRRMDFLERRNGAGAAEWHEYDNDDARRRLISEEQQEEESKLTERIRVRSVQAASGIDIVAVLSKVFGGGVARTRRPTLDDRTKGDGNGKGGGGIEFGESKTESKNSGSIGGNDSITTKRTASSATNTIVPIRHIFGRTNIVLQLPPPPNSTTPRYVAVFRFGSVVFLNVPSREASRLLENIKRHAVDPIASGFERRESFELALRPSLDDATPHTPAGGRVSADRAVVRNLDMNTVGVVSNIMAQTVALDWHNDTVDELLGHFSNINAAVERKGSFKGMAERRALFRVVARNNSLFIDMVGRVGIKDRSDTAWNLSQYEGLHEGMRREFDLDERFKHIEFKLNLIQQNAKFFLEVLHAQKSNTLEWVIIVLISFECGLMILEMSGMGSRLFSGELYNPFG